MTETHVSGVQNPETGQIGSNSIMGVLGEHLALAVYLDSGGLYGFLRLENEPNLPAEFALEVPQLQASFEKMHVPRLNAQQASGIA